MHPPQAEAEVVPFFRILSQDKTRRVCVNHGDTVELLDVHFVTVAAEDGDHSGFLEKSEQVLPEGYGKHTRCQAGHIGMQRVMYDDEYRHVLLFIT